MSENKTLQFSQLKIGYPSDSGMNTAVRGVSLKVQTGEIVSVVGESGSGKSSIFNAIGGFLVRHAVVEGEISVGKKSMTGISDTERREVLRNDLGFIFQDPSAALNPLMRVERILSDVCRDFRGIEEAMKGVGLNDTVRILKSYPHQLSGGMKQRIMIAAALLKRPSFILADEPTASLDASIGYEVMQIFKSKAMEGGCGVLLITHDFHLARQFSDRIVFMKQGVFEDEWSRTEERAPGAYAGKLMMASELNLKPKTMIDLS